MMGQFIISRMIFLATCNFRVGGGGGGCLGFIKLVSGNFLLVLHYYMVFPSSEKYFFLEKVSVYHLKISAHNTS